MAAIDHDPLVRFVRETLGCGCPDEVLAAISCQPGADPDGHRWTLDVGGRLLVWVVTADPTSAHTVVAQDLQEGIEERNRRGFNRFRLVVVSRDQLVAGAARAAFATANSPDDRVHLHVVPPELLPEALRG